MITGKHLGGWTGMLCLACSVTTWAAEPGGDPPPDFDGLPTASSGELEAARGADGELTIVRGEQNMSAGVNSTSFTADTIANGTINIGDNAFDGYSGVGINVLNTGNGNAFSTGITAVFNLY